MWLSNGGVLDYDGFQTVATEMIVQSLSFP